MATFTWIPSREAANKVRPRILQAKFGDGYTQRGPDGLNTMLRSWTLSFNNRTPAELDAIEAFLREQGGYIAFDWTPPDGAAGKWICDPDSGWARPRHNLFAGSLSCTFTEVPA